MSDSCSNKQFNSIYLNEFYLMQLFFFFRALQEAIAESIFHHGATKGKIIFNNLYFLQK